MSLEMAHKVILPPKKNYIPQFLKQRDINSYSFCLQHEEFSSKAASRLQLLKHTKLSTDCKVAGGIRELHAAPIMLAIYR
jgi:hypothetical protein